MSAIFNRRAGTRWSGKELKALKEIEPIADEDLRLVEDYYRSESPKPENICRRDLQTLLNNFSGEVDRARKSASTRWSQSTVTARRASNF